MDVNEPGDDWLEEPICPDCKSELTDYSRYLSCPDCGKQWKRVVIEERYRPIG